VEVTEKFSMVAYRIRLPDRLSAVHDVFHVSQLKKCEQIPEAQIIEETNAEIEPDLSLAEYLLRGVGCNILCFCSVLNSAFDSLDQVPNHLWSTLSQNPSLNPSFSL
jgi:hypothetical protein